MTPAQETSERELLARVDKAVIQRGVYAALGNVKLDYRSGKRLDEAAGIIADFVVGELLTATRAAGDAPAGWKLVPIKSNRTMTMAACDVLPSCDHVFGHAGALCANVWERMVDAAPAFPRPARGTEVSAPGEAS